MPLTTFVDGQIADADEVNANFALCMLTDTARTVTVTHTYTAAQTFTGGWSAAAACTISSGGLTLTSGSLTLDTGNLTVTSGTLTLSKSSGTALASASDISIATGKLLALNAGKTTYISESSSGVISLYRSSTAFTAFTSSNSANDVDLQVWDVTAAAKVQVTRGASDSGGVGFRCLRVAN